MSKQLYDMHGKCVYLSGPVSGHPREQVKEQFEAAQVLCQMSGARYVYNPTVHVHHEASHTEAMLECLDNLTTAKLDEKSPMFDVIVQLDGWNESSGAVVEGIVADALGIQRIPLEMIGEGR